MIFIILFALLLLLFVPSFLLFRLAFYNANRKDVTYELMQGPDYDRYHDKMLVTIQKAEKIPYEEVQITSYDGLTLVGRLYVQNPGKPVHIQFHGYRDNGIKDFCGGLQIVLKSGDNALVVDQRAHGKSQGHVISFGIKERYDVISWLQYVNDRFGNDTPLFLEGISMGGATVLMASDLNLPRNLCGIIADCPYSDPFAILKKVAGEMFPLSSVLTPFIFLGAFVFGHFNIRQSSALRSVAKTKVPILIIHGTEDHFVPVEMSRQIRDANPTMITLVEVEGAPHGLSYLKDHDLYEASYMDFIRKYNAE